MWFCRKLIQLLGNVLAILDISWRKSQPKQFYPGYFGKLCCICDLQRIYYLSVKMWPCSLWVEIIVNLRIYFLVWSAFCHRNFGKFYLKQYLYYINFWNVETLLGHFQFSTKSFSPRNIKTDHCFFNASYGLKTDEAKSFVKQRVE